MELDHLEIKRKLFHITIGIIFVVLIYLNILNILLITILLILAIITSLISRKIKIPIFYWFLIHFERQEYIKKYPGKGAINLLAGVILTLILFDRNLALASILILALGDGVSTIVGKHFGKNKHIINPRKHIEGTIAGIIVSFFAALIFLNYKEALAASIIGMIAEAIELRFNGESLIDDNIVVPLFSGLAVLVFRMFI